MRQLKITKSITNRESASLDKYLQEIGREELITVEEEVELALTDPLGELHLFFHRDKFFPTDLLEILVKRRALTVCN